MVASTAGLVGSTWEAKDGKRVVCVRRERTLNGVRHLDIINLESRRRSSITATGLFSKFMRATPFT